MTSDQWCNLPALYLLSGIMLAFFVSASCERGACQVNLDLSGIVQKCAVSNHSYLWTVKLIVYVPVILDAALISRMVYKEDKAHWYTMYWNP